MDLSKLRKQEDNKIYPGVRVYPGYLEIEPNFGVQIMKNPCSEIKVSWRLMDHGKLSINKLNG